MRLVHAWAGAHIPNNFMSEPKVFDSSKHFEIKTIDGKRCLLRFPTDAECCERVRRHKQIQKHLGRGKTQFDEARDAKRIDAELFEKIRIDKEGPAFDENEAAWAIDRLDRASLVDVERAGEPFRIRIRVPGAITTHTLKVPSQRQVDEYVNQSNSRIYGERHTEIRQFIDPAGPFYDSICVNHEGYAGKPPITHKFAAVTVLLKELTAALNEDDPEE